MKSLLLIKIGGGVITDKKIRYGLKPEVLKRIAGEIARGIDKLSNTDVIIGNGAGSYAHFSAKEYDTANGFKNKVGRLGLGYVRHDAVKLNQIVFEELLNVGLPVFSFSPSSFISVRNGKTIGLRLKNIEAAFEKGIIPLVHGDTMIDEERGSCIYSTEKVFDTIAKKLANKYLDTRVIHISSEDGVLIGGSVLPEITNINFDQIKHALMGSAGVDVTGGMLHKVRECLAITKMGIESVIVSGIKRGRVSRAVLGNVVEGTAIR